MSRSRWQPRQLASWGDRGLLSAGGLRRRSGGAGSLAARGRALPGPSRSTAGRGTAGRRRSLPVRRPGGRGDSDSLQAQAQPTAARVRAARTQNWAKQSDSPECSYLGLGGRYSGRRRSGPPPAGLRQKPAVGKQQGMSEPPRQTRTVTGTGPGRFIWPTRTSWAQRGPSPLRRRGEGLHESPAPASSVAVSEGSHAAALSD